MIGNPRRWAPLLAGLVLLAGCGTGDPGTSSARDGGDGDGGAVPAAGAVANCGVDVPVQRPERVVAMFQNGIEAVLALGAGDRLVGAAYLDNPIPAQLDADFRPENYWPEEYPSREEVLRVAPDLVVSGFTGAFTREGLGTRAELGAAGARTFLFSAYCPDVDGGNQQSIRATDVSFAAVERDLTDLGRLLGAPDRAARVVDGMRATLDEVARRLDGVTGRPRVAMLNSPGSTGELRVFGTGDVATTIIEAAGGRQAFDTVAGRQRTVSLEGVVAARPDVIVIPACCGRDVGPEGAEPLAERLRNDPALATVPAIRDGRVFTTTFAEVSPGIRNADAVAALARRLHPDRFGG
ncbi:ABC transporter substrate-binding protein [Pseudonocardia sp. ICBG1293]|uniref:ABC transporter substrate-binding protein n=1 Tax=Pseudonocardia sp. ICBG1293 TaxID=2844382 RepID=UPI001CC9016D|nr:ABC transporter substrate-binding protein [Pseudonocardia sp. ICBG1293]